MLLHIAVLNFEALEGNGGSDGRGRGLFSSPSFYPCGISVSHSKTI